MRQEIEKFCNDIKVDYCWYLYSKGEKILFPYCCKVSADIVTSFLNMVCSNKFLYICTTFIGAINHAWTIYDDGNESFIIDFTRLQHTNGSDSDRMKKHDVDEYEFKAIIEKQEVIFDKKTYETEYNWMQPKEQKCIGVKDNFDGKLNYKDFMSFLRKNCDAIAQNTHYSLY